MVQKLKRYLRMHARTHTHTHTNTPAPFFVRKGRKLKKRTVKQRWLEEPRGEVELWRPIYIRRWCLWWVNMFPVERGIADIQCSGTNLLCGLLYFRPLWEEQQKVLFNPLNLELNPICYLLALLGAHHFLHVSRIRFKLLTFRRLMSHIYGAPILDVSRSHTTTQHSR